MRFRPFGAEHRAACLAIFDSNVPGSFRVEERAEFEAFLAELPGPYLVLMTDEGRVVACGGVAAEGDGAGSLCWGMVHRSRQGEGLGRALLQARIELMEADPRFTSVRLETVPATVGFFERMGFTVVSREPDGYAPGVDRAVLVRNL